MQGTGQWGAGRRSEMTCSNKVVAARGSGDVVLQAASRAMGDGVKSRGTGVREEGIEQERPSSVRRRVCVCVVVVAREESGESGGVVRERVGVTG